MSSLKCFLRPAAQYAVDTYKCMHVGASTGYGTGVVVIAVAVIPPLSFVVEIQLYFCFRCN